MVVIGASFDTVEEQAEFASSEKFAYSLISDADRSIGRAYQAEREDGSDYPLRISYLIDPDGNIAVAYDLDGTVYEDHADVILADIAARS